MVCLSCFIGPGSSCENGEVRLAGGEMANQGRVEVCYNGVWGSVCAGDGEWTQSEASVVCKQLGYNLTTTSKWLLIIISLWSYLFFNLWVLLHH